jgi:triacylglycerol esterase/lipase EstA (alpha/beta hydrolase family)
MGPKMPFLAYGLGLSADGQGARKVRLPALRELITVSVHPLCQEDVMTTTASKHADPHLDVVFVHGLGSDDEAWLNKETKFDWPTEVQKSDPRLRVLNITHHAPMFKIRDSDAVDARFEQTAISFLDELKNQRVGERPIVFVTHSLGGIIVKEALWVSERKDDPILKMTRGVVFLSTPHAGAAVANVAGYLAPGVRSLGAFAAMLGPFGILVRLVIEPVAFIVRSSRLT